MSRSSVMSGRAEPRVHREVVSFVRRSARMNESQERAWRRHHSSWVIEVPCRETSTSVAPEARVDWAARFGRQAPLIVEIGTGTGDALHPLAAERPDTDFVALEVFKPAVASMLGRLARDDVRNVRILLVNATEALTWLFEPASITELWTFFPDPWHKPRHHKRRLINAPFAELVADRLADDGVWRLATDWADYADWIEAAVAGEPRLVGGRTGRWPGRVETRYEGRALAAGRAVTDFTYRRPPA